MNTQVQNKDSGGGDLVEDRLRETEGQEEHQRSRTIKPSLTERTTEDHNKKIHLSGTCVQKRAEVRQCQMFMV